MNTTNLELAKEFKSESKDVLITALSTKQYWNVRKEVYSESPCMEVIESVFYYSTDDFAKEICSQYVNNEATAYMTEDEANVVYAAFMKL